MRHSILSLVLLSFAGNSRIAAQHATPEPFTERHVTLDVRLDYPRRQISGAMTIEMENWTTRPAQRVSLLLGRLMEATRVTDGAGAPLAYSQDVRRFEDMRLRQVTQLIVELPRPVAPGARTTVRVEYEGNVVGYTEVGWNYVRDRIDTAFTILRSEAGAFPGIESLNAAANRRGPASAFTYDASVRIPASLVVATGGAATRTPHDDGTVTWRYLSQGPAPFLNIAIAPFDVLNEGTIHVFHFREDSIGARQLLRNATSALGTLAEWFGPQRNAVHLSITEIPDGWGSQADLFAGVIQTAAAFRDDKRMGEMYHELTHLWNVPDLDAPSPRWNEGLATFLEWKLTERVSGWTGRDAYETRYLDYMKKRAVSESIARSVALIDYGKRGATDLAYSVGALMFATLHQLVGEGGFNAIVGGYYQRMPTGGTTRDFVAHARRVSPLDLSAFFDDWMFTTRWTTAIQSATTTRDLADQYRSARASSRE